MQQREIAPKLAEIDGGTPAVGVLGAPGESQPLSCPQESPLPPSAAAPGLPSTTLGAVLGPVLPASDAPRSTPAAAPLPGPKEGGTPFSFGPPPPPPCSVSRCLNGHEWVPTFQRTTCPGCQAPILALAMQNCPTCNEPTSASRLRLDHLPFANAQILPLCRGSATFAEALAIEIEHKHAQQEEQQHVVREVVSKI